VNDAFLEAAIAEAKQGMRDRGIPIGSVLVHEGKIIGRGHNQRVQRGSVIHHAEMNCLENAGRQTAAVYRQCTIYTTLSPCAMCTGAILLYGIPRVVIGENATFLGAEESLRAAGVQLDVLQNDECIAMMREFIANNPALWNEDIGA
jgi:cytosine deaminase